MSTASIGKRIGTSRTTVKLQTSAAEQPKKKFVNIRMNLSVLLQRTDFQNKHLDCLGQRPRSSARRYWRCMLEILPARRNWSPRNRNRRAKRLSALDNSLRDNLASRDAKPKIEKILHGRVLQTKLAFSKRHFPICGCEPSIFCSVPRKIKKPLYLFVFLRFALSYGARIIHCRTSGRNTIEAGHMARRHRRIQAKAAGARGSFFRALWVHKRQQ